MRKVVITFKKFDLSNPPFIKPGEVYILLHHNPVTLKDEYVFAVFHDFNGFDYTFRTANSAEFEWYETIYYGKDVKEYAMLDFINKK